MNRSSRLRTIQIEDEIYSETQISNMTYNELHMLVSFCDNIKQLNFIKHYTNIERVQVYIDNLIIKCGL